MRFRALAAGAWAVLLTPASLCFAAHVNRIVIEGTINPAVAEFLQESIDRSVGDGALALVVQLDTPGGLLNSTRSMVKSILGSPVPIVVYVAPSGAGAGSAGVFITMAAHVAAMAPGTNIGAAHPVGGAGETLGKDMREKVENFTASFSQTIADRRGRNAEWAEKAVRESVSITEREALEKNVVDFVAVDLADLFKQAHGKEVELEGGVKVKLDFSSPPEVANLEMRVGQKILNVLADPNIAYLLFMAALLGLYMEFSHPGVIFPGVAGAICLILALAAFQVLPINYTGLLLLLLGLALLVTEAFLPSFGVIGIGGIVSFVLGSLLLFDTPESTVGVDSSIAVAAGVTVGVFMLGVAFFVVRSQSRRQILGTEGLLGEVGEVRVRLAPRGKVWVHGEYWTAEAGRELEVGTRVRVIGVQGMVLKVEPLEREPQQG